MRENEAGRCYLAGFEDGRMGHEPRNAGGLQKLKKTRKPILPLSLQNRGSPADSLILPTDAAFGRLTP